MKKREIDGILERLREIAGTQKDVEMCEKLGISYGTLDNWKARDNIPEKRLKQIAKDNGISYPWLDLGKGDMLEKYSGSGSIEDSGTLYGKDDQIVIPYHEEVYASAGGDAQNHGTHSTSPITFSKDFLNTFLGIYNFKGLSIINAAGDSMDPTIKSGELMFVSPMENEEFKDGGVYVLMCANVLLVKRVTYDPFTKEYTLVSDNGRVSPVTMTIDEASDCRFVGRVVGHLDRI